MIRASAFFYKITGNALTNVQSSTVNLVANIKEFHLKRVVHYEIDSNFTANSKLYYHS